MTFNKLNIKIDKPGTTLCALILASTMLLTSCWFNPAWLSTALADLPVLVEMAQAIAQIVAVTSTTNPATPQEVAAINQIGSVATQGLTAIDNLYLSYSKADPTTTITQIQTAGEALIVNLQQLLAAAQIKDPALLGRVTAAVQLIIGSLHTFLDLLPHVVTKSSLKAAAKAASTANLPKPKDLRQMWQQQVGFALHK